MATFKQLHDWNLSPTEAVALQKQLASGVLRQPLDIEKIETIAGADISFNKFEETIYAGIVVLKFPYIPGLLSFREIPALLEAWQKLEICRTF